MKKCTWHSSIFGIYLFAGGFVGALGLISLLAHATRRSGLVGDGITRNHFHALGRLLFAFTIFWAYIAFFQAMLIRIANLPEEVRFYLPLGHFVLPFLLLLPRSVKLRPAWVAAVGAWIVFFHFLDVYWLVLPVVPGRGALPSWLDVAALTGLVGVCVAFAAWRLRGRPLIPVDDPLLDESIRYESPL